MWRSSQTDRIREGRSKVLRPGRAKPVGLLAATLLLAALLLAAEADRPAAVANYGQAQSVELSADELAAARTLLEVVKGYGDKPLVFDNGLSLAARELALDLQADLARSEEIFSSGRISELLRKYGIYEISIRSFSFTYTTADDLRAMIRLRFGSEHLVCTNAGVGASPAQGNSPGVAVVILSDQRVLLSPFPRRVNLPSLGTLQGRLVNSARGLKIKILLSPPAGQVQTIPVKTAGDSFSAAINFNQGPGLYRLEVVAAGGGVSLITALLVVEAGAPAEARSATFEVSGADSEIPDEATAEAVMVQMINQVRVQEGLPILLVNPRLARMAKAHSQDMMTNRFFGHVSPRFGAVAQRAQAAGLGPYRVQENVAISPSLVQAMNNLLQSPVHRAPIIDPGVTHVGVGIVFDDRSGVRQYYITQEFADMD